MQAVQNFFSGNQSLIMKVVYVLVALIALYYLYKFLIQGSDLDVTLLNVMIDANRPKAFALPKHLKDVRVKPGGEYTISFWMYLHSWDYRSGLAKSVLQIVDSKQLGGSLLTTILYPNEPKMMVRIHTDKKSGGVQHDIDYTQNTNAQALFSGSSSSPTMGSSVDIPMCDVQDVDLQRWINFTISVNGRIVDVYYDGKLNRSCVLPDIPMAPLNGAQSVIVGQNGGFGGKFGGIQFFGYPLTPDRIYAIYQAGPATSGGFLGWVSDKLGFNLTYSGK
jgi:hypothetical protein